MTDMAQKTPLSSTDDVVSYGSTWPGYGSDVLLDGGGILLGYTWSSGYAAGFRFPSCVIPVGATITSATLSLCSLVADSAPLDVTVWGHDADSSAAFSATTNTETGAPGYRTRTTASVRWNVGTAAWAAGTYYTTPDIASVIQEICSRSGRSETFNLSLLVLPTDTSGTWGAVNRREVRAIDGYSDVAHLNVSYTVSGGAGGIVVQHMQCMGGF